MDIHDHAEQGNEAALLAALADGIPADARNKQGETPLMLAAGSEHADAQILHLLLAHDADPNGLSVPPKRDPPDPARWAQVAEEFGLDCSVLASADRTPSPRSVLSFAAQGASIDKLRVLLDAGADANYVTGDGYSVLTYAMYRSRTESHEEHLEVLRALIAAGAPLDPETIHGETPVSVASQRGEFAKVQFLLDQGADPAPLQWTPLLHSVAAAGDINAARKLIDEGADLDHRDAWQRTPFLLAVQTGNQEIAKLLLEKGADLRATGRCGLSALRFAIMGDDAAMLQWLVSKGLDIEQADDFGDFPLLTAAREGAVRCVEALVELGARVDRARKYESTALKEAESAEIVKVLVAAGVDLSDVRSEMRLKLISLTRTRHSTKLDCPCHLHSA